MALWVDQDVDVAEYVPDLPTHQGRALRPMGSPASASITVALRLDDRGGLDRRPAAAGWPLQGDGLPEPQRLHARVAMQDALQPDHQCRLAQALFRPGPATSRPPGGARPRI